MVVRECEYFVLGRTKPKLVFFARCSLTGKTCYCDGGDLYLGCIRRAFALDHESKQAEPPTHLN